MIEVKILVTVDKVLQRRKRLTECGREQRERENERGGARESKRKVQIRADCERCPL